MFDVSFNHIHLAPPRCFHDRWIWSTRTPYPYPLALLSPLQQATPTLGCSPWVHMCLTVDNSRGNSMCHISWRKRFWEICCNYVIRMDICQRQHVFSNVVAAKSMYLTSQNGEIVDRSGTTWSSQVVLSYVTILFSKAGNKDDIYNLTKFFRNV